VAIRLDSQPHALSISIRDYGPGVPDQMLSDIFKPFFRVDPARDNSSGGAGLGLAIAERAVTLHHGQLSAANMSPGLLVSIQLPCNLDSVTHSKTGV
jgi:two-component system sensor histidine kinase CpxA